MRNLGRRFALAVGAVVALGLAGGAASAAPVSPVSLQILVDGEAAGVFDESSLDCTAWTEETFRCAGSGQLAGIDMAWDMIFDSDPGTTGISGTTAITNPSLDDQRITLIFTLPAVVAPASLMGGDVEGDVTDNVGNGSTLTAPTGSAFYTARIDGETQQALFADPFTFSGEAFLLESFGSQSWGTPIPSFGPAAESDISIQLDAILSGTDSASFTSTFAVPEPDADTTLLLGVGLLSGLALRRRS